MLTMKQQKAASIQIDILVSAYLRCKESKDKSFNCQTGVRASNLIAVINCLDEIKGFIYPACLTENVFNSAHSDANNFIMNLND